jgi:predicted adenylyl cyclase CyaB
MPHATEIEVKIKLADKADAARLVRKLTKLGAKVEKRPFYERNELYDWPDKRLRKAKQLLRVRWGDRTGLPDGKLTFKGPQQGTRTMKRLEIESFVNDPDAIASLLCALGFQKWWAYEGYRRRFWFKKEKVEVSLDRMPLLGWYFEIEAPTAAIVEKYAKSLGYSKADYIIDNYLSQSTKYFAARGKPLRDLVFTKR